jgi:hypothetical protein
LALIAISSSVSCNQRTAMKDYIVEIHVECGFKFRNRYLDDATTVEYLKMQTVANYHGSETETRRVL